MMADERNDLPPVNSPNFLAKVREALSTYLGNRGNKLDRGLTVRDLADAGIIKISDAYRSGPGGRMNPVGGAGQVVVDAGYTVDLTPPPTPTGFTASAGFENILITVDVQTYTQGHGHARTRLYGSTATGATFDAAELMMDFVGTVASYPATMGTTYHLWVTNVSKDNVKSVAPAPANDVYGLEVTTAPNIPAMLNALSGQITGSELAQSLNTRIDLIDTTTSSNSIKSLLNDARTRLGVVDDPVTGTVRVAQEAANSALLQLDPIRAQIADIAGSPEYDPLVTYLIGQYVKYTGKLYQAIADTTGNLPTDTAFWKLIGEYASLGDAIIGMNAILGGHTTTLGIVESIATASQTDISGMASRIEWDENLIDINRLGGDVLVGTARVSSEAGIALTQEIITSETEARATQTLDLYAKYANNTAGLTVEQETRADRDAAQSSQVTSLVADFGDNKASLKEEQTARADAVSAVSSQITTLTAVVKDSAASLVVTQTTQATADAALSSQVTTLAAETGENRASLQEEQVARTTDTSSLASQALTLAAATANAAASLKEEQSARADAVESVSSQVTTLKAAFGDNQAGILSEQSARADATSATASQLNALVAKTGASDAAIVSERVARTTDDGAMASQISGLTASIGDTNASITTLEKTKIGYATKGTVAFDNGGLITDQAWVDAWNAANPTDKAVWHIGLPLAQAVKQVSITTGGYAIYHDAKKPTTGTAPDGFVDSAAVDTWNSSNPNDKALWIVGVTAAIEDKALALELENGKLSLSKTIKIDDNGRVSGYGIASENSHSQFIASVDTFAVTIPESSILVVALDTTIYAVGDLIKLVAPTPPATSAKIWMCLKAGKVTAAAKSALTAAEAAQPIGYAYKNTDALIADWQLTTRVPFSVAALAGSVDGVPIPTGAYMDGAYVRNLNADHITYGTIDGNIVHAVHTTAKDIESGSVMTGDIKSNAVVLDSVGIPTTTPKWQIKSDGTFEAQAANITGTIKAATGSIGGITIANDSIYSSGVTWNQGVGSKYFTGTGFGVMPDGVLLIGNAAGNRLTWDGVNLNVVGGGTFSGALSAATGNFGGVTVATNGSLSSGQTAHDTGTGFWLGDVAGTKKFSLGNSSGHKITWDGSALSIKGTLNGADGTFSGTLTADAVNAVNTINIAGNAVTVSNIGSGSGSASTNIVCPANQIMRVFAVGGSESFYTNAGMYPGTKTVNLTLYGATVSSETAGIYGTYGGAEGFGYSATTLVKGVTVTAGASPITVTASCSGGGGCSLIIFGMIK